MHENRPNHMHNMHISIICIITSIIISIIISIISRLS